MSKTDSCSINQPGFSLGNTACAILRATCLSFPSDFLNSLSWELTWKEEPDVALRKVEMTEKGQPAQKSPPGVKPTLLCKLSVY